MLSTSYKYEDKSNVNPSSTKVRTDSPSVSGYTISKTKGGSLRGIIVPST